MDMTRNGHYQSLVVAISWLRNVLLHGLVVCALISSWVHRLQGHEKRVEVYNLYHILNHDVLFGGMYLNQARGMIDRIVNS